MQACTARLTLAAIVLALARAVEAAPVAPPPDAAAVAAQADDSQPVIEEARRSVRSTAEWLARGVDGWFGNKPFTDGGKVTDGKLSIGALQRQHESLDMKVRFNARFRLPNIEANTYLFIGRDNPREVVSDTPVAFSRDQRLLRETAGDRAVFAGIGRTLTDSIDTRVGFRGGLKPYVQGRYRRPWQTGPNDLVEFRETVFWSLADHFGSTTALSYEHAFSATLAGRWLNSATITQADHKLEWNSSLGAYQSFGTDRTLSFELLATGKRGTGVAVTDYGLQARWEQPVYKTWLLGELVVGHFWPRAEAALPRSRAWALGGGLSMRF